MKMFETPRMRVVGLDMEDVMTASSGACGVEVLACIDCYCSAVTCDPVWDCNKLNCPTLFDL